MNWSPADIADAVCQGLLARARADDLEQVVYGFDCLRELDLHPLLHSALADAGYGVWPEQRYPGDRTKPKRSEGRRCDIVLTDQGAPLRQEQVKGTLFDTDDACDPEQAYWLEVKTVAQFDTAGPFARYSAELLAPVTADVKKLWLDPLICHAGLLLVLFTARSRIAEHDLATWHQRCLDRGYLVAAPTVRGFQITDRIGNGYCTAAVFAVRGV